MTVRYLFNVVAVLGCTSFAGVLLTIWIVLGGQWAETAAIDLPKLFALQSQFISRVIPIVAIPTIVGLLISLWFSWLAHLNWQIWLAAAICIGLLLIFTFMLFAPTNARLSSGTLTDRETALLLKTWLNFHGARVALAFLAAVLSIIAAIR